ncbi:hypothetical protein [Natrarchaeobaculum aegyptiacum]|uniref:Uncharacterized protein n=1 Tax=Natrarchaeobaculum aegyptiacum TaxID=745377 RepID=A0A2Z2I1M0_9EURY|nr:hypothetical protein [Natrarchaeobaculum aegyptiacum]ARS91744.1 hypothetical protein B1756_08085 [Natrarchaeobaculum aegyptiacum]
MQLKSLLTGNPSRTSKLYLGIGLLSLIKAIAVRDDRNRFKRELVDAGLYLAIGVALHRYARFTERKRTELQSQAPDWLTGIVGDQSGSSGQGPVGRLTGETTSQSESSSVSDRVRGMLA